MKPAIRSFLLLFAASVSSPVLAGPLADGDRMAILSDIDRGSARLSQNALQIWGYGELGFQEHKSSALLQKELKDAGFTVKANVAGMPTAFIASFKTGNGPVIGILAEFDALPGLSQAPEPLLKAQPGMDTGHGCGHNLFGAASVAAAIATKNWMTAHKISGEVRVYGSPAEEGGSGKVFLVREGLTRDVSAMIHWHPGDANSASQGATLANVSGKFRFTGIAAHAAAAPDHGRSALDGVEAMNDMVNMMREHIPQETRIHYVITDGGKAPNVVPATAEVYYYVRHPSQKTVAEIMDRVKKAAEGAALGTGTTVSFDPVGGTFDTLPNDTLGRIMDHNLRQVTLPSYTAAEQDFVTRMETTFPKGGRKGSLSTVQPYVTGLVVPASSDVGDVSYTTPTVGMGAATWAPGTPAHSWQAVAASGHSIGVKGATTAAKAMALTAAELMQSPDKIAEAKAELEERRGPDFVYRSLLGDKAPALDYRKAASN